MTALLICLLLTAALAVPAAAEETQATQATQATQSQTCTHSWQETDSATCTQDGILTKICTLCGTREDISSTAAKGHRWDGGTVTVEATCTDDGVKTFTCSGCPETKTETIAKLSPSGIHSYSDWKITSAATCKDTGTMARACTLCGHSELSSIDKLTTHSYDSICDEDCNVCGLTRTVTHSFTTTWSKDYNGHWRECTKCGKHKDEAKHTAGAAATETTDQVCTICSYVIAAKKPHTHSYGTEWTKDEVGHWHACTNCTEERDYAAHRYDDDCDSDCNTCGYKRQNSHTYDREGWNSDSFAHWNLCAVCKEESEHEKHLPGDPATDKAPQLCTVCGYELAPIQEHSHDFGTFWHQDAEKHWQECECGEQSVPAAHVWDEGKENRNDTVTYTCTLCAAEKTVAAEGGFPWLIVVLSVLALVCLGGIGVLVYFLKNGTLGESGEEEEEEELPEDFEPLTQEEEEDKMIDDYFASLNEDSYR